MVIGRRPGLFNPTREALLTHGDYYMHLADLKSYSETHARLGRLYADPHSWAHKAILNVASSGKFFSDRTIAEYARGFGESHHVLSANLVRQRQPVIMTPHWRHDAQRGPGLAGACCYNGGG